MVASGLNQKYWTRELIKTLSKGRALKLHSEISAGHRSEKCAFLPVWRSRLAPPIQRRVLRDISPAVSFIAPNLSKISRGGHLSQKFYPEI